MLQAAMQSPTARKSYLALTRGDASRIQDLTVDRAIKDDKGTVRGGSETWEAMGTASETQTFIWSGSCNTESQQGNSKGRVAIAEENIGLQDLLRF